MTVLFAGFCAGQFESLNSVWPPFQQTAGWFRTPAQGYMVFGNSSTLPSDMYMLRVPPQRLPANGVGILQFTIGQQANGTAPNTSCFLKIGSVAFGRLAGATANSNTPLYFRQMDAAGVPGANVSTNAAGTIFVGRLTCQIVYTKTSAKLYVENVLVDEAVFTDVGLTDIVFQNHVSNGTTFISEVIVSDETTYKRAKLGAYYLPNALLAGTSQMTGDAKDLMTPRGTTGIGGNAAGQVADVSLNAPSIATMPGNWGNRKLYFDYRTDNPDFAVRFSHKINGTDPTDTQIAVEPAGSNNALRVVELPIANVNPSRLYFRLD